MFCDGGTLLRERLLDGIHQAGQVGYKIPRKIKSPSFIRNVGRAAGISPLPLAIGNSILWTANIFQ